MRVRRFATSQRNDRLTGNIGTIETLKHLKKDVDEIRKGMDCGIAFEGFTDLRPGDEVVSFSKIEVPRTL